MDSMTTAPVAHHAYILGKDSTGRWVIECDVCVPPIRTAPTSWAAVLVRRDHDTVSQAHVLADAWTMQHGTS